MSFKATGWWIWRGLSLSAGWAMLVGGGFWAISNTIGLIPPTIAGIKLPAFIWVICIASWVFPCLGYVIIRRPAYYPPYVGGHMGYRNKETFEKAKVEVTQNKK